MARLKPGDIVEIGTSKGLAYGLCTHRHRQYGTLIRVIDGLLPQRPGDLASLARRRVSFSCFVALPAAADQPVVSIVGHADVPPELLGFPTFRAGIIDPRIGKVALWWLWDGDKEWPIGALTPEQRRFPIRGIWDVTLLVERIESGWTAETDPWT